MARAAEKQREQGPEEPKQLPGDPLLHAALPLRKAPWRLGMLPLGLLRAPANLKDQASAGGHVGRGPGEHTRQSRCSP